MSPVGVDWQDALRKALVKVCNGGVAVVAADVKLSVAQDWMKANTMLYDERFVVCEPCEGGFRMRQRALDERGARS
jgi:hypothetical protein